MPPIPAVNTEASIHGLHQTPVTIKLAAMRCDRPGGLCQPQPASISPYRLYILPNLPQIVRQPLLQHHPIFLVADEHHTTASTISSSKENRIP